MAGSDACPIPADIARSRSCDIPRPMHFVTRSGQAHHWCRVVAWHARHPTSDGADGNGPLLWPHGGCSSWPSASWPLRSRGTWFKPMVTRRRGPGMYYQCSWPTVGRPLLHQTSFSAKTVQQPSRATRRPVQSARQVYRAPRLFFRRYRQPLRLSQRSRLLLLREPLHHSSQLFPTAGRAAGPH
jgi:hypothetical protein